MTDAYVSFKDKHLTIDFRIHAPSNTPIDVLQNEVTYLVWDLRREIAKQWGERATKK